MAGGRKLELRIYCICGQKMKVRDEMLGRPAKCVACRQKIRIPHADEIPPGAAELHLKDHPEFLRKPGPPRRAPDDAEKEVVALGDEADSAEIVALDVIEPLRLLCSLERKYGGDNAAPSTTPRLAEDGTDDATALEKTREARAELDNVLRRWLREVTEELEGVREELAQLALAVRTGDRDYLASRDRVLELRGRRDRLERRRHNLRGWLACDDPYLAGGYLSHASLDRIPKEGFRITFPPEPDLLRSLIEEHVGALRDALFRREQAERKLIETERVISGGKTGWQALTPNLAAASAEKKRADALVSFARDRVERLCRDSAGDAQAIEAQIELARERLAANAINRARFDALKLDLRTAAAAVAGDTKTLAQALRATRAQDVPRMRKAGLRGGVAYVPLDAWIGWAAAVILAVSVFLPIQEGGSPLSALRATPTPLVRSLVFGLMASAIVLCAAGFVPHRATRGILQWSLWVLTCLAGTLWIHIAAYSPEAVGLTIRKSGLVMWLFRPGPAAMLFAELCAAVAAWTALAGQKRLLHVCLALTVAAVGVAAAGMLTDFGGLQQPQFSIFHESRHRVAEAGSVYETRITVENQGGRPFCLIEQGEMAADTCRYVIEKQMATGVWSSVGPWEEARLGGNIVRDRQQDLVVGPGSKAVFLYELPPGHYRVRLLPSWQPRSTVVEAFELADEVLPDRSTDANAAVQTSSPPGEPEPAADASPGEEEDSVAAVTIAQLKGIASAQGRDPRFVFVLELPDGTTLQRDVTLGMELHEGWKLTEYNPENQAVTVVRDAELLILRRGEPTVLPDTPRVKNQRSPSAR